MSTPILATKLHIPTPRPKIVTRQRLIERLNEGLSDSRGFARSLSIVSAPAGFGKTTLLAEWLAGCDCKATWLSLDEGDSDPASFLSYLVAALQRISAHLGEGILGLLASPQPPPINTILTNLINEITELDEDFSLVFDDYHLIDSLQVDEALTFLLEHMPARMHLVIATREDPNLPLARLRARGQMAELRAADLRFTPAEAAEFLNQVMGLDLSPEQVAALESRTEGWIAGLQLAAISMRGVKDSAGFIQSFTGSHHYVLDYLIEEVLEQQPEGIQSFLLQTSILERLHGSLCDALTGRDDGQKTLEYLEASNLFIVPLDNERVWFRYHHLFAELLRRRLEGGEGPEAVDVDKLHCRASTWFEENNFELEAFQHAAAANDVARAARLIEGEGMPLQYRGAMLPVMNWLASLPSTEMDANPSLWVTYASALTMIGQPVAKINEVLKAAEAAVAAYAVVAASTAVADSQAKITAASSSVERDEETRDLIGQIAAIRAMIAIPQNQVEAMMTQSRRALEYLHPDNLAVRTTAAWTLGYAYQLQGERAAAIQAYEDTIPISQASGNTMITIGAETSLGQVLESQNQLQEAADHHQEVLRMAGDPAMPAACEAHLGLARIHYQWNDLDAAQQHGQESLQLARQMENVDTPAAAMTVLAHVKLAQRDPAGASDLLSQAEEFLRRHPFMHRMPEVAATQVLQLLQQGDISAAERLSEKQRLPTSQARVHLAKDEAAEALAILEPLGREAQSKGWQDELLQALVLQALARASLGEKELALQFVDEALAMAEPGGFIRIFLDEGAPMAALLQEGAKQSSAPAYVRRLLDAFGLAEARPTASQDLLEPLTERELEVLRLLGTYLTGPEIARELMVSLNTMRTHTKNIYTKLGVNSRKEAVQRAEELDLV